jgi:Double zinc ribbon
MGGTIMRKLQPAAYPRSREQVTTAETCFFICMMGLVTAEAAFAQNARVPGTASSYVVDGLALGARVNPESPAYRGYQCSPSELFPEFTRCQRTQKQQEGGTRRSFEATSSTLHGRDGKAVYINRNIAPWSFDRNEIQDAIKQLASKFGERAREMRLPPREGVQTAIIAVWGKIQLTELDADAVSILASGESPRKGMLIDYLGNLQRSAQLGLPVYSLSGGAGYIWSASVDRNNRGHIRFLTVDPSAVSPAAPVSSATAAQPAPAEIAKTETAEKPNAEPAPVEPDPPVEPDQTSVDAAVTKSEVENIAAPEADKVGSSLVRLEKDLATAETKIRVLETLAYCAVGGLIVFLMIAASLLLAWRKRASATRAQVSESEAEPALRALHVQGGRAQTSASEKQTAADMTAVSRDAVAAVAAAVESQNRNEQKHYENKGQTTRKATRRRKGKNVDSEQSASATTTSCVHCHREISVNDKFCMHCGAAVAARDPAATRLCSSCREEIGASDKFCRHCGASSMAVAAPSMTLSADSA